MKYIETVGNLMFYADTEGFAPGEYALLAINGSDVVASSVYCCSVNDAVNRLLNVHFDTYSISDIRAAMPVIRAEYNGALLSGLLAGFSSIEYFKRIDDTEYYKHFTHRPMM